MAIAVTQGHVQRAIEFYNKLGKYFIIGGTKEWDDESAPPSPSTEDYKLIDVVGLKKVDNCHLIVPDPNGSIHYRSEDWRIVLPPFSTQVTSAGVLAGDTQVPVKSIEGFSIGSKIRVGSTYEGKVTNINYSNNTVTLDTEAPSAISAGATVEGGALVEGAKYVYVDCSLRHDKFPIVTYRQLGLCTDVPPALVSDDDILRSATYAANQVNEYSSLGVLEVIDNRAPSTRNVDQVEELSLVLEF